LEILGERWPTQNQQKAQNKIRPPLWHGHLQPSPCRLNIETGPVSAKNVAN
jgi:hypothetical protein